MRKLILVVLLLALFALPALAQDEAGVAHLRVAHFAADAPNVDVFSDGVVVLRDVPFGTIGDWLELAPDSYNIAVSPTGRGINAAVIGPTAIELAAGDWITVAAVGSVENETISAQIIDEDFSNIGIGNARVTLFHAAESIPAVDILVDGESVVDVLAFRGTLGDNDGLFVTEVPAGVYNLSARVTSSLKANETDPDDVLAELPETELALNGNYLIAAIGTPDAPQVVTAVTQQPDSLVDALVRDGRFGTLLAAAGAAGLTETLDTGGPYTVFAPSDGAFAAVLEATGLTAEELLADTETLTTILTYHVLEGTVLADDAVAAGTATTLQGGDVTIEQGPISILLNGNVNITRANITASNGVAHIINEVLIPRDLGIELGLVREPTGTVTIAEVATGAGNLSTLLAAVEAAGLTATLSDPAAGPFTVFAPTDEAFAAALDALGMSAEDVLGNTELLTQILQYHVIEGVYTVPDLVARGSLNSLQGASLSFTDTGSGTVNNANIIGRNFAASNGIVHVIDAVLLPPSLAGMEAPVEAAATEEAPSGEDAATAVTVVDQIREAGNLAMLLVALDSTGLSETLSSGGPYTILAPSDEAFMAALSAMGVTTDQALQNPELLTTVLTYHVIEGEYDVPALIEAGTLTTLQGEDVTFSDVAGGTVNDSAVIVGRNFRTSNGIVHIIDAVLLPAAVGM